MAKAWINGLIVLVCVGLAGGLALAIGDSGLRWAGWPLPLVCAAMAFAVQWLVFVPSFLGQSEHYYDLTGSLTYLLLVTFALSISTSLNEEWNARALLLCAMVWVWALRLGSFLFLRIQRAGKDGRFDEIKPFFSRFLLTWTLQGLWVFVTLAAALAAISAGQVVPLSWPAVVGFALWLGGLSLEAVADAQKTAFNRNPVNAGRFVNVGLWRWSRHPNYAGEILLWLGVAVVAMPALVGWQWLALVSPLFVYLLLTRISGIPLLERRADEKWEGDPDYWHYKAVTPVLWLRPPDASGPEKGLDP